MKEKPSVVIIIPAWKEGEIFKFCLNQLTKINYPNIRLILNVGGSEKTIMIAREFEEKNRKNFKNIKILYQKKGEGKLKAINDAINNITEEDDIIWVNDADIFLDNDIFYDMLTKITEEKYNIVSSNLKPHNSQIRKDLVNYIFINRNAKHKIISNRIITPNFCLTRELLIEGGVFPEKQGIGDGDVIDETIKKTNFNFFKSKKYVQSFNYPEKIKEYFDQNLRWVENTLFHWIRNKDKKRLIKYMALASISLYLFIFPFFWLIFPLFFYFGLFILLCFYLKKINKVIIYKKEFTNIYTAELNTIFYFKLLFYIYLDLFMNICVLLELVFFGKKKYNRRKNFD